MALQAISQLEHYRLLERLKLRERDNPEVALEQQQNLNSLFGKYTKLIGELEKTIGEYRKAAAPVSARVILNHKSKTEKVEH